MKLSLFGRLALSLVAALALGLSMSACGGGTIAYLWVPGEQYNEITGFKVDDYTGNLTEIPHAPFASQGSAPVMMVIKPGGRYVYVINQGTGGGLSGTTVTDSTSSNIALFSVGGDGVLTFQQSYQEQGAIPQWAAMDSSGSYLFVLDKYSPSGDGNGSITAWNSDSSTGRLTLIQNTQSIPSNSAALTYFEVGKTPTMLKQAGSCLYTLNTGDQTVTPFSISSGQLVTVTTGNISLGTSGANSINGNSTNIIITDGTANRIYPYTAGTSCALTSLTGGSVANETGSSNPSQSFIDTSGTYVFVLNQSNASTSTTSTYSTISAWSINTTNGELVTQTGAPYTVGSGPQCMVEDPTAQYMYISDYNDGTITGKLFDSTHGYLSTLTRGSTFTATGQATCLALSSAVD